MNTDVLQYCIDINRYKSFTKVAAMHYMTQQALSQQIKNLEDSIGVQLFDRSNRNTTITPAGTAFIAEAQIALTHIKTAIRKAQSWEQGYTGLLSIGCSGPSTRMHLIKTIKSFSKSEPSIDLNIKNATYNEIVDSFKFSDEFDLIAVGDFGEFDTSIYNLKQLRSGPVMAVFGKDHPLANRAEVTPDELRNERLICLSVKRDQPIRLKRMERFQEIMGELPSQIRFVDESEAMNMLVACSFGFTFLNEELKDNYNDDLFNFVKIKGKPVTHPIYYIWRKSNTNPALTRFLEITDEITTNE